MTLADDWNVFVLTHIVASFRVLPVGGGWDELVVRTTDGQVWGATAPAAIIEPLASAAWRAVRAYARSLTRIQ